MLLVLSPAKSLDFESTVAPEILAHASVPLFMDQSAELNAVLRELKASDLADLMDLSESLAELNFRRNRAWSRRMTAKNSRPAVLAFNGDVYDGLQAKSLPLADLLWAQERIAILSGLYGVLRPLDRMQAYRLEMGRPLRHAAGSGLYSFWGDSLALHLNKRSAKHHPQVLVNLASQEYFKSVKRKSLQARVVECVFEDFKNGDYKVISFFAKRARGLMARFAITERLTDVEQLKFFDAEGYRFTAAASGADQWVFRRKVTV